MRLSGSVMIAVLLLSSGLAAASPAGDPSGDSYAVQSAKAGGGLDSSAGILTSVGLAGGAGALTALFKGHNKGTKLAVVAQAPEIGVSGLMSGMILLLGGGLILRGRQQSRA